MTTQTPESNHGYQPKPGDKIFRPRRIKHIRLKIVLGIPGLFSAGYGDVGSSIYYALGIVAIVALGTFLGQGVFIHVVQYIQPVQVEREKGTE